MTPSAAAPPPPTIRLRLLGRFELSRAGQTIELAYAKGRALLAYLTANPGRNFERAALAALIWPDLEHRAALGNLRQVLRDLRHKLGETDAGAALIRVDRASVGFAPHPEMAVDTVDFCAFEPACRESPELPYCRRCLDRLAELAASYRGPYVEGLDVADDGEFADWLDHQRQLLHRRALRWLTRLCDCHEALAAPRAALPHALRRLELAPDDEAALYRVMELAERAGRDDLALVHYESWRQRLARELGVVPSPATVHLAEAIGGRGRSPASARRQGVHASSRSRRPLTVLVGELLPEADDDADEAYTWLAAPRAAVEDVLRERGGHLVPAHGRLLVAYFGYPAASEQAVRQAAEAARVIAGGAWPKVAGRAAVHAGITISDGVDYPDAAGAATALAHGLVRRAAAGEVLLCAAAARRLRGHFSTTRLPPAAGTQAATADVFRLGAAAAAEERSPLIGRDAELAALRQAWSTASGGRRRIVLLRGDAGIGKSRLVRALREAVGDTAVVDELHCAAETSGAPFQPLIRFYRQRFDFRPDDTPARCGEKIASHVAGGDDEAGQGGRGGEAIALYTRLLGLLPPSATVEPESGVWRRQMLEQLLADVHGRARGSFLLVIEDLHWADPSTLEFIDRLVDDPRRTPLLLILTARPEFTPPWSADVVSTLDLAPLTAGAMAALVDAVAPELPAAVREGIVRRADGVPLFAEELALRGEIARSRQTWRADAPEIPATLFDLLTASLDRLGEVKHIVQTAAAIGRRFEPELLAEVAVLDRAALAAVLRRLEDARLLHPADGGQRHFRHVLIRDAADATLARVDRAAIHRRIAEALRKRREPGPDRLARHLAAAGDAPAAAAAWLDAGTAAIRLSATREAIAHFEAGLSVLGPVGDDGPHAELERRLRLGLSKARAAAEGYAADGGVSASPLAAEPGETCDA